jgi:hypothetical protein
MNEINLTAYCGLYCGDCIRYKSKVSLIAKELLDELDDKHYAEYAKIKQLQNQYFEHYESMIKTLTAITSIYCEIPCRKGSGGCNGTCAIMGCVKTKSINGCWECEEFEQCNKLEFLKPFHGETPKRNLRKIKELGLESWSKQRDKCYPWL